MPDPTRQDSLNLLKNTRELEDYYANNNKYMYRPEYSQEPNLLADPLGLLKDKRYNFDARYEHGNPTALVQKHGPVKEFLLDPSYYYKDLPGDNFQQRELANSVLNINAPMARYNTKIAPTEHRNYLSKSSALLGASDNDNVDIFGYDPVAVTPADMLSDDEIIQRVNKHGPSGIPISKLKALGLPLPKSKPVPKVSEASKKRRENRDLINQQLKEAGLYNRATGITGRNPEASRMYEEYMRSKQPSQSSVPQVPNQVQSAGEAIKQPIEERIPEGYQLNLGYRGADGRYYGNTYNPTTSEGKTYPVPGAPTMEDYKRIRAAEINPERTGTRFVRADFAAGGVPPTEPPTGPAPTRSDSIALYNNALAKAAFYDGLDTDYELSVPETDFLNSKNRNNIINSLEKPARFVNNPILNKDLTITQEQIDAFNVSNSYLDEKRFRKVPGTNLSSFGDIRRDGMDRWFHPSAPPILLHPNISPQGSQGYRSKDDTGFGDKTDVPYYDPIAIAPWDTLSTKDKKKRKEKYGTTGTPWDTGTTEKPRSESSLKREEARNILKKEMDTLGFTGYSAREVSKKGSEAEKAYQKHLGNYTETKESKQEVKETPKKIKESLPEGYTYKQYPSRDGDMNDYLKGNKRISREEFIKATGQSPTQFRERHVEIPKFRDGGPINNDGPLAKPQGDIYLPLDGTRPSYIDASGKERSEYKIGVGTKEGEMVIPTVWNGEQHTEDEAIDRYYNTGEHMGGPYDSIEEGERAAKLRTFLYNEHPAYRKKAYGGPVKTQDVTTNEYGHLKGFKDVQKQNIFGRDIHKRIEYDNYGGTEGSKTVTKEKGPKGRSNKSTYEVETTGPNQYSRESGYTKTTPSGKQIQVDKAQRDGTRLVDRRSYDPTTETLDIRTRGYMGGNPFAFYKRDLTQDYAYGGCAPKYAQGGQLYEAEGGEVIDGGNPITLQGGHISPNSSNSGKIVGNSHGNGGVKMTGGEKIYSDRLTVDASFLKDLDI